MSSNTVINPKDCSYGCSTRIYWNTAENAYFEVFTKQKHICKNRSSISSAKFAGQNNNTNRPFNNKRPWSNTPKPKMSNSFELLSGSIPDIQKKYEILSDIVITEYNGKVHGSQRGGQDPRTGQLIDLLVYYEVPLGQRDEVKRKFNNFNGNLVVSQRNY